MKAKIKVVSTNIEDSKRTPEEMQISYNIIT